MKLLHKEKRPWGHMLTLFATPSLWLKYLRVRGATSYQSHQKRTEWVVGVFKIKPGDKHRYNSGYFIELATGRPDEEDITRYDDEYGRS